MPDKPLTITIPEPDRGVCRYTCPVRYSLEMGECCALGLGKPTMDEYERYVIKPGPKCPQYQGDSSCPTKTS